MTDDICDSWEDVDVDKIVIKPAPNSSKTTKPRKPTYSSILAAGTLPNNDPGIISNNFDDNSPLPTTIQQNGSSTTTTTTGFRIMQRVSDSTSSPFTNQPNIILEDNTRQQYVKGLRILNRPNKNNGQNKDENSKQNGDAIREKLKKSFEEKQAEYAKARLRILGETTPAEDLVLNMADDINKIDLNEKSNSLYLNNNNHHQQQQQQEKSSAIIRQPIAPDGTKGFQRRR